MNTRPLDIQNEPLNISRPNSELSQPKFMFNRLVDGLKIENKSPIKLLEIDDF